MPITELPTLLQLDKKRRFLVIEWGTGNLREYAWDVLRKACPCAGCRSKHGQVSVSSDTMVFNLTPVNSYELEQIEVIGNYAIKLMWSDGHSTGIYSWDYLHGML
jgi:DUF971 family protein